MTAIRWPSFRRTPRPPRPNTRPVRLRVIAGEHVGGVGYCMERDRFESGEYGPGLHVPIDIVGGPHAHIIFEDLEVIE